LPLLSRVLYTETSVDLKAFFWSSIMTRHLSGIFCLIFLSATFCFAQEIKKISVAVNDFTAEGIEESSARIITDRIRAELINSGSFRIMERGEMDKILREQGFQQSGACTDQSCLVEVGQLLGVEKIVAGTIGKLGTLFTISMRIVDVRSGEILATVNQDCQCSIEDLLSTAVPSIAKNFTARMSGGTVAPSTESVKTTASLSVASVPSGAKVLLNDKVVGSAPFSDNGLKPGDYSLKLDLDGYQPKVETITLASGKSLDLSYTLMPMSGSVKQAKGAGKNHKGQTIRKVTFGIIAVAAGLMGVRFERLVKSSYQEYKDLRVPFDQDKYDVAWKKVQKNANMRNVSYIAAGISVVGFGVSFAF
jgi:TolB-like protein